MQYITREQMEKELEAVKQEETEETVLQQEQATEQNQESEAAEELSPAEETPQDEEEQRLASLEKALKDTKAWATRLAQENAALKKAIEELKQGTGTQQQVDRAYEAVQAAQADFEKAKQKIYEDYPEFRDILEPLFEKSIALEKKVAEIEAMKAQLEQQNAQKAALEYFNTYVKPEVLKIHPDFDEIVLKDEGGVKVANEEFFNWASMQSPALQYAALHSNDPRDIIWAISEYKKYRHTPDALKEKAKIEKNKQKKLSAASAMTSMNTAVPEITEPQSEEDIPVDEWIKKRNKEVYGR